MRYIGTFTDDNGNLSEIWGQGKGKHRTYYNCRLEQYQETAEAVPGTIYNVNKEKILKRKEKQNEITSKKL